MDKIKVLPIGSCRVYRPFSKRLGDIITDNTFDEVEVVYPRFGFFHSIKEIAQALSLVSLGGTSLHREYANFLFRKEPPKTTPGNEFDERVLSLDFSFGLMDIDAVVIEISSLDCFLLERYGLALHWNPNFVHNVSYSDIYPSGYYESFFPQLGVVKRKLDLKEFKSELQVILSILKGKKLFLTTHIHDKNSATRKELFAVVSQAVKSFGEQVKFIDNTDVFERFGYRKTASTVDIHHLSDFGEMELGNVFQNTLLRHCR